MWRAVEALGCGVNRLQARCHWASRLANIVSCGAMLGSAMFDPISADEDHRYCEIILPLFAVSAVVWHLLNLNSLLMAGRFTIPLGLAILLLLALLAGPSRMDLAAWLPLYVTTVSLLTMSLSPILGCHTPIQPTVPSAANDLESSAPLDDDEEPPQDEDLGSPALARWEREPAARYHLLGRVDHRLVSQSARTLTTLSLSSTPGQPRSSWGSRVLGFWLDPMAPSGNPRRQSDSNRSSLDGLLDMDGMPNNG